MSFFNFSPCIHFLFIILTKYKVLFLVLITYFLKHNINFILQKLIQCNLNIT